MPASSKDMAYFRSLLFIPAHRSDFVESALSRGADAIILDLEDGVPSSQKASAREAIAAHILRLRGTSVLVRINPVDRGGDQDIKAICAAGVETMVIPKVELGETLAQVIDTVTTYAGRSRASVMKLVATIESPKGVLAAAEIAKTTSQLAALAFGSEDYSASLGIDPSPMALLWPAQQLVTCAAAAGLAAFGIPGGLASVSELERFREDAELAASVGFTGAMCVSPRQVAIANLAFLPSNERVHWARDILDSAPADLGAIAHRGQMIDEPIVRRAQAIIAKAVAAGIQ